MNTLWAESVEAALFLELASLTKCGHCRHKFSQPWLVPTGEPYPNNVVINADLAFHWQDSHGFPADELERMINDSLGFKVDVDRVL